MSKPYLQGSIAGIFLTDDGSENADKCKAYLLDGGAVLLALAGNVKYAADGTPKLQVFNVGTKGAQIGVLIEYAPLQLARDIIDTIKTALLAGDTFTLDLADEFNQINSEATWDFTALPAGPQYPEQRTNESYIKNFLLRFILS